MPKRVSRRKTHKRKTIKGAKQRRSKTSKRSKRIGGYIETGQEKEKEKERQICRSLECCTEVENLQPVISIKGTFGKIAQCFIFSMGDKIFVVFQLYKGFLSGISDVGNATANGILNLHRWNRRTSEMWVEGKSDVTYKTREAQGYILLKKLMGVLPEFTLAKPVDEEHEFGTMYFVYDLDEKCIFQKLDSDDKNNLFERFENYSSPCTWLKLQQDKYIKNLDYRWNHIINYELNKSDSKSQYAKLIYEAFKKVKELVKLKLSTTTESSSSAAAEESSPSTLEKV